MVVDHALVVGAGIMGLTTALKLVKHGCRVTVLSKNYGTPVDPLASQVAAGMWKIPAHSSEWKDNETRNNVRRWAHCSYDIFSTLANDAKTTGVFMRPRNNLYYHKIDDEPQARAFMDDHRLLPGFRHSDQIIEENGFSANIGFVDAFSSMAPLIDTDVYMNWLTGQCVSHGVDFIQGCLSGSLLQQCDSLRKKYKVDFIVNCTGVSARQLAEDSDVYPGAGGGLVLHLRDAPFKCPRFATEVQSHWHDEQRNIEGKVVIVSRGDHSLWLGTIEYESYNTADLDVKHPYIQRMLHECQTVYPPLRDINQEHLRLTVGIRPMRKGSPRVEQDPRCSFLIHNYGHCGLGVMLSWGCAEDVLEIVKTRLSSHSKL